MRNWKPGGMNTYNGDTSKRWYFWYFYRVPAELYKGRTWQRFKESCNVNYIKNKRDRLAELKKWKLAREKVLDMGWSPYDGLPDGFDPPGPQPPKGPLPIKLLSYLDLRKSSYGRKTYQTYNSRLKHFLKWLKLTGNEGISPSDIKKADILTFLTWAENEKGLSYQYVTNIKQTLYMLFDDMLEDDVIAKNPCNKIKRAEIEPEGFTPYVEGDKLTIFALTKNDNPTLYIAEALVYYAGIRPKEMRDLLCRHIDLNKKLIQVPGQVNGKRVAKGRKTKYVKIYPKLHEILTEYLQRYHKPGDYLLTKYNRPGIERMPTNYLSTSFSKIREKLNLPEDKKLYALKHTATDELLEKGANPFDIAKHFRHGDVKYVLKNYGRGRGELPTRNFDEKIRTL